MEQKCSNCRYEEFDSDAFPCRDCCNCSSVSRHLYWAKAIENIDERAEVIKALLETQTLMLLEIGRLRGELNSLIITVKEKESVQI
jgi:hypothetical protein